MGVTERKQGARVIEATPSPKRERERGVAGAGKRVVQRTRSEKRTASRLPRLALGVTSSGKKKKKKKRRFCPLTREREKHFFRSFAFFVFCWFPVGSVRCVASKRWGVA